jgi:hypothetical protein
VLDRVRFVARRIGRFQHFMKTFFGLVILAVAVAFLSVSCDRLVNCKCVGRLYAEDGTSEPATVFVEFNVWPWWVLWSDNLGKLTLESHEPSGIYQISYFRRHPIAGHLEKYELTDLGGSKGEFKPVGVFSTLSGSIGIETPSGNFVGNCEKYQPVRLTRWP